MSRQTDILSLCSAFPRRLWAELGVLFALFCGTFHLLGESPPAASSTTQTWWAFQPLQRPAVPRISNFKFQISNPVDAFINARFAQNGLTPNARAGRRELIRRASFDLLGLPPTFEEVTAFASDPRPDAWERLLDRLLARPEYGERWGRHWLDVVRFAQSNGYERDGEKPFGWRYRDYVVRAFNADKPYDQFVREHLAGDELEPYSPDGVIATGYARLGVWDDEPDDKQMAAFDELDDVLSTTGIAFLGLTLGCARCHEHKFDPIPHADYYRLLAFFRGVQPTQHLSDVAQSTAHVPLGNPTEVRAWRTQQAEKVRSIEAQLVAAKSEDEKKGFQSQLAAVRKAAPPFEHALAMREAGPDPEPTFILKRGSARSPGEEVQPAFLSALTLEPERRTLIRKDSSAALLGDNEAKSNRPPAESAGRRRLLADWISSPGNPLTARVIVNRVWHHHFGRGIVSTTGDFGRAGTPPTHPELLDWLADEFITRGWSLKQLHKLIMTSEAYRRSSMQSNQSSVISESVEPEAARVATDSPITDYSAQGAVASLNPAATFDPGNDLFWRQNLRRLEAEAVRDTILSISGRLNLKPGGRGFFPHLSGEVLAGGSRPGTDWEVSPVAEQSRRSLYAYVRRTSPVPFLESLDYANFYSPLTERATTTVAPQALLLLNDDFMRQQAAAFAARVVREVRSRSVGTTEGEKVGGRESEKASSKPITSHFPTFPPARFSSDQPAAHRVVSTEDLLTRAYQLALARNPTGRERALAHDFLRRQREHFGDLRSRLSFRAEVPATMNISYFGQLKPGHFFSAPAGWTVCRGSWPDSYEGNQTMHRGNGPFAVWSPGSFTDATITARVLLNPAFESGGLLLRAGADGDKLRGYELAFDLREQRLALRRHDTNVITVAQAAVKLPASASFPFKVEIEGPTIRAWMNGDAGPTLAFTDPSPLPGPGAFGVRAWGSTLSLDELRLTSDGRERAVRPPPEETDPERRALEALCLLLLNLNEVIYAD